MCYVNWKLPSISDTALNKINFSKGLTFWFYVWLFSYLNNYSILGVFRCFKMPEIEVFSEQCRNVRIIWMRFLKYISYTKFNDQIESRTNWKENACIIL